MLVVFNHAGLLLAMAPQLNLGASYLVPSEAVAKLGAIGVDLFFVISGFVMVISARRFIGPAGAGVFLVQRFVRIAPLFYLASLVMLAELLRAGLPIDPVSVLNSITFIPVFDDSVYSWPLHYLGWTLAFEWVFYLMIAVLIAGGRSGKPMPLIALVLIVPLFSLVSQPQLMAFKVLENPILWEFALGVIACILYEKNWLGRLRWQLVIAAALLFVIGAFAMWFWPDQLVGVAVNTVVGDPNAAARSLVWGVAAFIFFCAAVSFNRVGEGRFGYLAKLLGDASYSIYLSHLFVVMAMREVLARLPFNPDLAVLVTLALSALVGIQVYRWAEKPMLTFGQRSTRRWSTRHMQSEARYQVEPPIGKAE